MVSMLKLSNSTEKLEFITISPAQPTAQRGWGELFGGVSRCIQPIQLLNFAQTLNNKQIFSIEDME